MPPALAADIKRKAGGPGKGGGPAQGRGRGRGGGGRGRDGRPKDAKRAKAAPGGRRVDLLVERHWTGSGSAAFDGELVCRIYRDHMLGSGGRGRGRETDLSRLELSGYLERYLWPHNSADGPPAASWEHTMSVVVMLNAKFAEGVDGWATLRPDRDRFDAFFSRALSLQETGGNGPWAERAAASTWSEKAEWVRFFVRVFGSLEEEMVRAQALRLVSLPMWFSLPDGDVAIRLAQQPQLSRPWKFLKKRRAKEAKMEGGPPAASRHEAEFLPSLLREAIAALKRADAIAAGGDGEAQAGSGGDAGAAEGGEEEEEEDSSEVDDTGGEEEAEAGATAAAAPAATPAAPANGETSVSRLNSLCRYLELILELCIDLMAQLPTRRFFHAILVDSYLLPLARTSAHAGSKRGALFARMAALLREYERFAVDDHTGASPARPPRPEPRKVGSARIASPIYLCFFGEHERFAADDHTGASPSCPPRRARTAPFHFRLNPRVFFFASKFGEAKGFAVDV
jgi:intron-binding protein aquarius